jgi:hypothetical protein
MHTLSLGPGLVSARIGVLVLVRAMQYVLGVRTYLTCAARPPTVIAAEPSDLTTEEREVLESADAEVEDNGFRYVGMGQVTPLLTYYERPQYLRLFVSDSASIQCAVSARMVPEAGAVVAIELGTLLADGRWLVTTSVPSWNILDASNTDREVLAEANLAALKTRHMARITAGVASPVSAGLDLASIVSVSDRRLKALHARFREKSYTLPTADPCLDRFTLRGALALTHASLRLAANRRHARGRSEWPRMSRCGCAWRPTSLRHFGFRRSRRALPEPNALC